MTCKERITELVECARRGSQPGRELRSHLAACTGCKDRWEAEGLLTGQFQTLRIRAAAIMAPDTQGEVLLRDFALANPRLRRRRGLFEKPLRSWGLALCGTAAVFAAIFIGHVAGTRMHKSPAPATRIRGIRSTQTVFYEVSADADALSSDDFIAIPYSPPLAQGELVRVVHADLYPEALASMGIDVDPVWSGDVPADVVEGEDGIPRAVRITENTQN
jgi:hypothetical protein